MIGRNVSIYFTLGALLERPIRARAEIELYPADVSGKTTGYKSGVRPNHFVAELGHTVIGTIEFEGREWLQVGERSTALVTFLHYEPLAQLLRPGVRWDIREGSRVVGKGKILEIIEST